MNVKQSSRDAGFQALCAAFIGVFALFCLVPFWMMVVGSFTNENELIVSGYSLFPNAWSLDAYRALLMSGTLMGGYLNSIFITIVGTSIGLAVSALLAYSIANKRNRIRNALAFFIYFTMLFNGGLVPFYLLVSKWLDLGNSLWAVILPVVIQPFLVFLMVSFFRTLPIELEESGRIDGANELRIFVSVMLPISIPIVATVTLFYAINYWNEWFNSLLFLTEDRKFPLQLILRRLISNMQAAKNLIPSGAAVFLNVPSLGLRMAATIVTIGPIILLYPFIQRYFVKGLTIGAVKG